MSVSPEEKKRYFQETAIALRREGFRIEPSIGGRLGVWLEDHPICEVDQIGGITYRPADRRWHRLPFGARGTGSGHQRWPPYRSACHRDRA